MSIETTNFTIQPDCLYSIKSKFGYDLRRYTFTGSKILTFQQFYQKVLKCHGLADNGCISAQNAADHQCTYEIWYSDPATKELYRITNDQNMTRAFQVCKNMLKIYIYGEEELKKKRCKQNLCRGKWKIGNPMRFRKISCLYADDGLPDTFIRIRIMKDDEDSRLLGLYIREDFLDNQDCPEYPHHAIIVDKIAPDSIVEKTGVISVGDEIVEINEIDLEELNVHQVAELMNACSRNLNMVIKSAKLVKDAENYRLANKDNISDIDSNIYKMVGEDGEIVYCA